jgi:thiol-disulfide isomerase/thioredoxin
MKLTRPRPLGSALAGAAFVMAISAALVGCGKSPQTPAAPAAAPKPVTPAALEHGESGIAWKEASTDSGIDAAFAAARAANKPVFVYWGAKWCPPCNQVKATLFNRQDFIERSRGFVPVYVDGDSPGAQKIGARFHVSGYPTMVLFNPQGQEVTRLPGEVDAIRYTQALTLGMNAARPVSAVLADALAKPAALGANDWRLLAFYSWDTDHQQVLAKERLPATLLALADACPADSAEAATRLRLKALAAADAKTPAPIDAATRNGVLALLADPARAREQTDMLTNYAAEIVRALRAKASAERAPLLAAFDAALKRLEADPTLSRADRMQAVIAQVDLARIDEAAVDAAKPVGGPALPVKLPAPLLADAREQAARADREITDGYERQAVITAAAYLLERAGLDAESDALLKANLARSHSPYYLMSELASNAKKRGDKAEALRWYREAFEKSEGPATRLQWGASYVGALVDLAPGDEGAIEKTSAQLLSEAATQPDAFYERSARSLQKVGTKLQAWSKAGKHTAAMTRLRTQLDALCAAPARSADERATCQSLLTAATKPSA